MNLMKYLKAKYPSGNIGMTKKEAEILNIPYPLKNGWIKESINISISLTQYRMLRFFLENKHDKHSKRGLDYLNQYFLANAANHIDLLKSTISATFPKVDLLTQENVQACVHYLNRKEEQNGVIRENVSAILRILDQQHIHELKRLLLLK